MNISLISIQTLFKIKDCFLFNVLKFNRLLVLIKDSFCKTKWRNHKDSLGDQNFVLSSCITLYHNYLAFYCFLYSSISKFSFFSLIAFSHCFCFLYISISFPLSLYLSLDLSFFHSIFLSLQFYLSLFLVPYLYFILFTTISPLLERMLLVIL